MTSESIEGNGLLKIDQIAIQQKQEYEIKKEEIEPLGDGCVFNLTDHLSDVIDDYETFNERRLEIKSLFRPGLFQNYAKYEHES